MFVSDQFLFPLLQLLLVLGALISFIVDRILRARQRKSGINATVTRGPESLAKFYGAYGVLTSIFVTLSVTVDTAKDYRTILVLMDVALVAYLCLWNGWSRVKIIQFTNMLPTREFS